MSTVPYSLDPISLNHGCSAVFSNLPILERCSRGVTHTYVLSREWGGGWGVVRKKTSRIPETYTDIPIHNPTTTFDHDPLRVPGVLKASSSNGTVGVTMLF